MNDEDVYRKLLQKKRIFFSEKDFASFLKEHGCTYSESTLSNIRHFKKDRLDVWYDKFKELLPLKLFVSYKKYYESLEDTFSFYDSHRKMFSQDDCLKTVLHYIYCNGQPQDWNELCRKYDEQKNKEKNIVACLLFITAKDLLPKQRNETRKANDFLDAAIEALKTFTSENRKCTDAISTFKCLQPFTVLSLVKNIEQVLYLYFNGSISNEMIGKPVNIDKILGWYNNNRTDMFWHIIHSPYKNEEGAYLFKLLIKQNSNNWECSEYDVSALKEEKGNIILAVSSPQMIRKSYENEGNLNVIHQEYLLFAHTAVQRNFVAYN